MERRNNLQTIILKRIKTILFLTLAHPNLAVVGRVAPNFTTAKLRLCRNVVRNSLEKSVEHFLLAELAAKLRHFLIRSSVQHDLGGSFLRCA